MCSGRSHTYVRTINHLASVLRCFCTQPVLTVMVSEMLVDWLKHAFITKFNHIRPSVYERYKDVLCRDLASGSAVGRRGARKVSFPPPPTVSDGRDSAHAMDRAAYICRSVTACRTSAGIRFASPGGPFSAYRIPVSRALNLNAHRRFPALETSRNGPFRE